MKDKGHFYVSGLKSAIRVTTCIIALVNNSIAFLAIGLIIAEAFGLIEEFIDKQ